MGSKRAWGLFMTVFVITVFATEAEESEKEDIFGALITTFVERWHPQKVEHAHELRRMVRSAGRHVRDLSDFMYPMAATASVFGQMMSFVPHIVDGAVTSIALLVDMFGRTLSVLGGGLEYSATAVERTGRSIQTLSEAMPTVVTAVSISGLALVFMFPSLQDWITSGMASAGLMLASKMAAGARTYVDDNSTWAMLLESFELFTVRARESME